MKRIRLLLLMPWMATPMSGRILAGAILVLQLLAVIAVAARTPIHGTWRMPQTAVLLLEFFTWTWSAMLSGNLQLIRNARELCLPRIARAANLSMFWLWGAGVVLPAMACIALGAPWFATPVFFVFAAATALGYMLLPFYLGLPLTIAAIFLPLMYGPMAFAGTWAPATWLWPTGLAVVIAAWRWWYLQSARFVAADGWNAAAVFYCYRHDAMRNGGWLSFSQIFLQRRLGVPGRVDFHRVGPAHPVAALRLALGGPGMPKPAASHLHDAGVLLAYLLALFALVLVAPLAVDAHGYLRSAAAFRLHWIPPFMAYLGVVTCCLGVSQFSGRTRALWRKQDAELPVLALLPGLGDAEASKWHVLRASLIPPALFLAGIAIVLCCGAFAVAAKPWAYLAIGLCCGGALLLASAVTLATLGGKSIGAAGYAILYFAMIGFAGWTLIAGMPTDQYHGPHPAAIGVLPPWLLLCWVGFLALLGCMACAGWRGLRQRPHVFLASAR